MDIIEYIQICATFSIILEHTEAGVLEKAEILSELPMGMLLKKRRSAMLELLACNVTDSPVASALINPMKHMQIRGPPPDMMKQWSIRNRPIDRGQFEEAFEEEEEEEEEPEWMPMSKGKGGKIGQLFDITVSALSFLAFGGYLLCLIIHVVKEKKETTMAPESQMTNMQQFFLANRPVAPVPVRLPTLAVRPGRRRRSDEEYEPIYMPENELLNNLIDSGLLLAKTFTPRR